MNSGPLTSVVMPCFNCVNYVVEAVASALAQTRHNVQVLVIDDGSTDGSYELLQREFARDPRVVILTHKERENRGVSASRRLGVQHAHGALVAFLDADDVFRPYKLVTQIDLLERHREAVLCHSRATIRGTGAAQSNYGENFSLGDSTLVYTLQERPGFLDWNPICTSSVVARRGPLLEVMPSFPQLFQYEDWATWVLLGFKGAFIYTPQELVEYRLRTDSATGKLLRSELRQYYSKMELILCLIGRFDALGVLPRCELRVARCIRDTLAGITMCYHSEGTDHEMTKDVITSLLDRSMALGNDDTCRMAEELKIAKHKLRRYEDHQLIRILKLIKRLVRY